ncbi:hypothetical protein MRX96_030694 [Rhipicephalus microplus]
MARPARPSGPTDNPAKASVLAPSQQPACCGRLLVNEQGTWDTSTENLDLRSVRSSCCQFLCRKHDQQPFNTLPVWRSGPLQEQVPNQTTWWPSGKRQRPVMVSAYRSPADILLPSVSSHFTQALEHPQRLLRFLRIIFNSCQVPRRCVDTS